MTIAILLNTSWNIYNFRLSLIKSLQKEGYRIIAVAPYDVYVVHLENEGVQCYSIKINNKGTSISQDLILIREYFKLLKGLKPDLILSYTIKPNIYGNFAARALGIPVINNVSGLGTLFIKKSISTLIALALYKAAFSKSDWVFFQNQEDHAIFSKKKIPKNNRTSILPGSGVDLSRFCVKREHNKGRVVLFVGRLIGDKGIREYIEAAKILNIDYPNVVFKIVGELGYDNKTAVKKEEIEEWQNFKQFEYLGKSDDMAAIYKDSDVMVLPSYREGLSRSLIEACAMGLPIVTTNVPGCKDVVENNVNGYLCEPKNSFDLTQKIAQLLDASEEKRLVMGANGRRIAEERFDEQLVIQLYHQKIKKIIN